MPGKVLSTLRGFYAVRRSPLGCVLEIEATEHVIEVQPE